MVRVDGRHPKIGKHLARGHQIGLATARILHGMGCIVLGLLCGATYFATYLGYGTSLLSIMAFYILVSIWFVVRRYPYVADTLAITDAGREVAALPAGPRNHHWTKGLIASLDGKTPKRVIVVPNRIVNVVV